MRSLKFMCRDNNLVQLSVTEFWRTDQDEASANNVPQYLIMPQTKETSNLPQICHSEKTDATPSTWPSRQC
jgi:hypothetical protein